MNCVLAVLFTVYVSGSIFNGTMPREFYDFEGLGTVLNLCYDSDDSECISSESFSIMHLCQTAFPKHVLQSALRSDVFPVF